ncbi:MAG: MarR family transcriptional regulator [Bacteroidetes bacterium]|nr:MAG: MarR family transcriptional regulator [Bacteroidota bacterium]
MKKSLRDKSIEAQMAIALQLMKRKNHQAIAKTGNKITMEQLVVLEILKTNGDMNMTELSKTVWKQNANITRIVDKLEKQELVERKPVQGDRRANLVSITSKGESLIKEVIPVVMEVYKDATSIITKEEEAITLNVLQKIISHLA